MTRPFRRSALRGGVVVTVAAAAALIGAAPAFAHVTAQPGQATQGGYTVITMRVPNESDTAGTVKLEVSLPADHPITSARTTPMSGWTASVVKAPLATPIQRNGGTITEAVSTVTWTAQPGTRIGPGEFVDFPLSVGPLPTDTDTLVLPATQTYDDGKVVAWNEPTPPGGAEPQRPAPTVTLVAADAAAAGHGHGTGGRPALTASVAGTDSTARWLGGAGLLLGALGLGLGAGAALRTRGTRRTTTREETS
ncbi:YcnI family copper-binding membrane protein [Pseudonocardia bannensis]|uniref:YcnI family protein n=1 Tax=Pseudonocardia bannensis TaxID=630973 RepID=A0A848DN71_9PSEU|nr:YcnI family protein [Pseudonocardia bannensis]NMH93969.1 YcnI family protein [Pseudonocardia bannensis]